MSAVAMSNATDARRMKGEWLRRRSGLRPSSEDCPVDDTNKSCSRCRAELGWVVNRGAVCQACRLRVCKACREYTVRTVDWVCTVCYKRTQAQATTGEWMNELAKKSGQWKENKFYISAADIIKSTIRRSWTICDPNPRWPTTRDSPEFRPYNSLPRGRDVTDFLSLKLQQADNSELQQQSDDPESLPSQRRISQFERTLSELYGSQKKSPVRKTADDTSENFDKSSPLNGVEISGKKGAELKPSKIPSPRKKLQYARSSETSALAETSKQILRKHSSLQLAKRHSSKSSDEPAEKEEKHVYFDDECKPSVNVVLKSGIPKREMKSRSTSINESKSSEDSEIEPIINECNTELTLPLSDDKDACELAGTVFRKVAIKKRRHDFRKTQAFDEGSVTRRKHRYTETSRDDLLDPETGRILLPEGDDYKLVFISSDSSSKEEDLDDNDSISSATTAHSFTIDDCDWDYFEPTSGVRPVLCWSNRNSPFGSPRVYRRGVLDSPLSSPLVYRRTRESDTGTDEDATAVSPASSDSTAGGGFLSRSSETEDHLPMDAASLYEHQQLMQCIVHDTTTAATPCATSGSAGNNQVGTPSVSPRPPCQSCGAITPTTQFVPIPVLVPIPVPVAAFWNPLDPVILYNTSDTIDSNLRARLRAIQQRTGALLLPYVNQTSLISSLISAGGDGNTLLSFQQQQYSMFTTAVSAGMARTETSMPAAAFDRNHTRPDEHPAETNQHSSNADSKRRVTPNGEEDNDNTISNKNKKIEFLAVNEIGDSDLIVDGYLQSENTFMSSTESSDSSGVSEDEGVGKPRIHRTYNVSGTSMRDSDDASSNVTSDEEDDTGRMSNSSDRHESSSSTPDDTDTDDTGTVADPKPKKFSKVFVVNNITDSSCSSTDTDSSSSSDTDTEQDCVVLNYIRPIVDATDTHNNVQDESVVLLKHVKSEDGHVNPNRLETRNEVRETDIVLLKHVTFDLSRNKIDSDSETEINNDCDSDSEEVNLISYKIVNDCDIDTSNNTISATIENRENYSDNPSDNTNIFEIENEISNAQLCESLQVPFTEVVAGTLNAADCTTEVDLHSARNLELISDTPTRNCFASEESKQIEVDLATQLEPILSNMKANIEDPALLQTLNEIDITPSETIADKNISSVHPLTSGDRSSENCSRLGNHTKPTEIVESIALSSVEKDYSDMTVNKQSEVSTNESTSASVSEWNTSAGIRSDDPVSWPRGQRAVRGDGLRGARTGAPTAVDTEPAHHVPAARYTSLVMITQESPRAPTANVLCPQVSIVPSDTTTIVPITNDGDDVVVRHTNWQDETSSNDDYTENTGDEPPNSSESSGLAGYFTLALDNPQEGTVRQPRRKPLVTTTPSKLNNETVTVVANLDTLILADSDPQSIAGNDGGVTVVTGGETLSAVVCLEEGLADDDSWVEDISHDEDEFATTTATDSSSGEEVTISSSMDQEEELRGYHRSAIDFTLHTIVEESCEESEVEHAQTNNKKTRPTSATDLEKYFFYRLGDGTVPNTNSNRDDAFSETSSIYSEGMDSLSAAEEMPNDCNQQDPADLASSRLEKYFLSGFMGFTAERRDSDGSVGSDSEGRPSPEQRRKRLVRARGTGRSHSSSLDNLLANAELSGNELQSADTQLGSENSSSSETDTYDEPSSNFEKSDGQFDTVKRKKCKKQRVVSGGSISPHDEKKLETMEESNEIKDSDEDDEGNKTPQPEFLLPMSADLANSRKHQSRDSGFIGSCDDLLKDQRAHTDFNGCNDSSPSSIKTLELKNDLEKITEEKRTVDEKVEKYYSGPPATTLTRKDSFNNWSSDEETNLMMSKMRQFFKTMVANSSNAQLQQTPSKPTTPVLEKHSTPLPVPSPRRNKPPQLVYFENELTRLMKTVPGIRDDQVREIVEYLSSEDTWSDSYDSSDYTSSDLECTVVAQKSALQEQISASCQQIINKFDKNAEDEEGDEGDGGIIDDSQVLNRETAFVYQKLVASLNKITSANDNISDTTPSNNSPPIIAKVMHHIGSRLVALMHEVSSGESHCSTSPKVRYHHRRLQQKLSSASTTTTEDDDSTSDSNLPDRLTGLDTSYNLLPRSRSHDLLLGDARAHHQSSSGVSDIAEEREASDYERFSWRGSFESALMATDSRTKLSLLGTEGSASASALAMAAKRRSAGDLLFNPKSLSREQLDRVRSCGSIGGGSNSEEKHWVVTPAVRPNRRRSSVPDATCGSGGSADGEDDDEEDMENRSTLPRSLQTNTATTNSLPRLPTTSSTAANMHKAQSMHHFLQHNVKSARYRPPGFNRTSGTAGPKRAVSAPGLQPTHPRRDVRRRSQQPPISGESRNISHGA